MAAGAGAGSGGEAPALAQVAALLGPAAVRRLPEVRPRRQDAAPREYHAVRLRMAEGGQVRGSGANIPASMCAEKHHFARGEVTE